MPMLCALNKMSEFSWLNFRLRAFSLLLSSLRMIPTAKNPCVFSGWTTQEKIGIRPSLRLKLGQQNLGWDSQGWVRKKGSLRVYLRHRLSGRPQRQPWAGGGRLCLVLPALCARRRKSVSQSLCWGRKRSAIKASGTLEKVWSSAALGIQQTATLNNRHGS